MVSSKGFAFGIIATPSLFRVDAGPCKPISSGSIISSSTVSADLTATTDTSTTLTGSATVVTSHSTSEVITDETTAETTGTETTAEGSTTIVETTITATDASASGLTISADTATTVDTSSATTTGETTTGANTITTTAVTTSAAETTTTAAGECVPTNILLDFSFDDPENSPWQFTSSSGRFQIYPRSAPYDLLFLAENGNAAATQNIPELKPSKSYVITYYWARGDTFDSPVNCRITVSAGAVLDTLVVEDGVRRTYQRQKFTVPADTITSATFQISGTCDAGTLQVDLLVDDITIEEVCPGA